MQGLLDLSWDIFKEMNLPSNLCENHEKMLKSVFVGGAKSAYHAMLNNYPQKEAAAILLAEEFDAGLEYLPDRGAFNVWPKGAR